MSLLGLLPASLKKRVWSLFSSAIESKPRRYLLVVVFLISFVALGGFTQLTSRIAAAWNVLPEVIEEAKVDTSFKTSLPLKALSKMFGHVLPVIWRACVALVLGCAVPSAVCGIVRDEMATTEADECTTDRKIELLTGLLEERAGIVKLYAAEPKVSVSKQPYSQPILEALSASKSLKLLSIAGYEYLGKGSESLLYEAICKRPQLEVQVVVLDPEKGLDVIKERVACLQQNRENTLSIVEIQRQIKQMPLMLESIAQANRTGATELRYYTRNPGFRIVILDQCLFFSCYDSNVHGHETPIFQVERREKKPALYQAFDQTFANIWMACKSSKKRF